jgi:hypothetical protein
VVALEPRARLLLELGLAGVADALDGHGDVVGQGREHVEVALAEGPHLKR